MIEVMRQRPSVLALVVGMNLERKLCRYAGTLDHPQEPRCRNWHASLGAKHIRTAALQWPQCSEFRAMQRMNPLNSAFSSVHMKATISKIDLAPSQGAEFRRSEPMSISE